MKNHQQKYFSQSQKNHCVFARPWYSLSMKEKEIQIQTLTAQIEQVAEDLLNPCLDNQTTVLIHHLGKLRKKLAELQK